MDGNNERLLTPGEVAALFRVDPKTVTRWAASGRITSIRTPGGHRRFRESEIRALLRGVPQRYVPGSLCVRPDDGVLLKVLAAAMDVEVTQALTWAQAQEIPYFGVRSAQVVLPRANLIKALRASFPSAIEALTGPATPQVVRTVRSVPAA